MNLALGLIETKGLVGAIEAADAMAKAADVRIVGKEVVTGALMVIKIVGEVAAVKSAVDAGSVAAQRVGQLVSAHVIPRPDDQIDYLITGMPPQENINRQKSVFKNKESEKVAPVLNVEKKDNAATTARKSVSQPIVNKEEINKEAVKTSQITSSPKTESEKSELPPMEELERLNVHELRRLARNFSQFPIKGRDISKANRGILLDHFLNLQK